MGRRQRHHGTQCDLELHAFKQESRAVAGNPRDAAVIFDP